MTNNAQTPRRPESSQDAGTSSPSVGRSQSRQQSATDASSLNTPVPSSKFYGQERAGSSHTGYIAPTSTTPYREPQLVGDTPALNRSSQTTQDTVMADWSAEQSSNDSWGGAAWSNSVWPEGGSSREIRIDGRDTHQELHWFNPSDRVLPPRPGPGITPPLLADQLHDPGHALYSAITTTRSSPNARLAPSSDETRTAIPHAQSYYCPDHNGWVLLLWGNATSLPPLVRQIDNLPDAARRKQTSSCVGDVEPFGKMNTTHHWHRYERAVDSRKLTTPYECDEDVLLDLYLCCQCSTYCMASDLLPGVMPGDLHRAFTHDKFTNPPVDRTPRASVLSGWETILT